MLAAGVIIGIFITKAWEKEFRILKVERFRQFKRNTGRSEDLLNKCTRTTWQPKG